MSCSERFGGRRVQILLYTIILAIAFILLVIVVVDKVTTIELPGSYGGGGGDWDPNGDSPYKQQEWLARHNDRREYYHALYNGEYVPLKWSDSIAQQSQVWANELARGRCEDYRHDPNNDLGENLAVIWGSDSIEWVMTAWVEEEELDVNDPYKSGHGHYTQVLWRATRYVGCAQSTNGDCNIYVCRYVKPGNCNRGKWTWLSDMMADDSPCGPHCPEEGCF